MQRKPEDVQHQNERIINVNQNQHSQEVNEDGEQKKTVPDEQRRGSVDEPTEGFDKQDEFRNNEPFVSPPNSTQPDMRGQLSSPFKATLGSRPGRSVEGEPATRGQTRGEPTLPRPSLPDHSHAQTPSTPTSPAMSGPKGEGDKKTQREGVIGANPTPPRPEMFEQPQNQNSITSPHQRRLEFNREGREAVEQRKGSVSESLKQPMPQNSPGDSHVDHESPKNQSHNDQSKVILVVDDSQTVRNIMALILQRAGYRSVRVASAMEALHTLTELTPDLIFLDITLPGMDGLDVCKIIKEKPRTKEIPVVMLSGNNEVFDKVMGRLAGASDYITKPFEPESILKCIDTYLQQKNNIREGLWQGTR